MINNGLLCVWIVLAGHTAEVSLRECRSITIIWNVSTELWGATELGSATKLWNTAKSIWICARELCITRIWNSTAKRNVCVARLCIIICLWIAWCCRIIIWFFGTKSIAKQWIKMSNLSRVYNHNWTPWKRLNVRCQNTHARFTFCALFELVLAALPPAGTNELNDDDVWWNTIGWPGWANDDELELLLDETCVWRAIRCNTCWC